MLTREEIIKTALRQSACDLGCEPEDFFAPRNRVVISRPDPRARRYLSLPFLCNIVYYGGSVVASVSPEHAGAVERYIDRYPAAHLFETPNLHVLNDYFQEHGARICFMAEYFLPDPALLRPLPIPAVPGLELRVLTQKDFADLYRPEWSNALCEKRRELDVLGIGAYDADGALVGLAACSADCEDMWQIGIDVLPPRRRQGLASALTSRLSLEILKRDKVPFYCAAWSNIPSVRNAVRSGFRPAWTEMTVKERAFTDGMTMTE